MYKIMVKYSPCLEALPGVLLGPVGPHHHLHCIRSDRRKLLKEFKTKEPLKQWRLFMTECDALKNQSRVWIFFPSPRVSFSYLASPGIRWLYIWVFSRHYSCKPLLAVTLTVSMSGVSLIWSNNNHLFSYRARNRLFCHGKYFSLYYMTQWVWNRSFAPVQIDQIRPFIAQ